jgi:hypothetical protein
VNGATMESKRWKLARAAMWGAVLLATAFFWSVVAAVVLTWIR